MDCEMEKAGGRAMGRIAHTLGSGGVVCMYMYVCDINVSTKTHRKLAKMIASEDWGWYWVEHGNKGEEQTLCCILFVCAFVVNKFTYFHFKTRQECKRSSRNSGLRYLEHTQAQPSCLEVQSFGSRPGTDIQLSEN